MSWRGFTDAAKRSHWLLRLADRMGRGRGRLRWIDRLNPPPPATHQPDFSRWAHSLLAAAWLGHATVLLRIGDKTVLTDPVFSNRIGIGLGMATGGPARYIAPPVRLKQLPKLDLILISHAHFDHLDRPTLARLPRDIPVITANSTSDLLRDLGYLSVKELAWGQSARVGDLSILAHEVRHWGARTFLDSHRGYNSYVLSAVGKRVLYGGDSADYRGFADVAPVDLAIVGIGAYNPYIRAHATPEQAWAMAMDAQARFVLPIHHSTFRLSHEPMDEPIARMLATAGDRSGDVVIREVGQSWYEPA